MYAWIWRKLPFGLTGKIGGSIVLIGSTFALLWFFAFPALMPLLPFNQSTIDSNPGNSQETPAPDDEESGEDSDGRVDDYDPSDYELEDSPEPSQGQ